MEMKSERTDRIVDVLGNMFKCRNKPLIGVVHEKSAHALNEDNNYYTERETIFDPYQRMPHIDCFLSNMRSVETRLRTFLEFTFAHIYHLRTRKHYACAHLEIKCEVMTR
jgi:hypothetical protein